MCYGQVGLPNFYACIYPYEFPDPSCEVINIGSATDQVCCP